MNFYEGKNVLVTGAGGFIGSHMVDALIEKKANVYALLKDKESPTSNIDHVKDKINILYSNMGSIEECLRITENIDIVLNLAAKVGGIQYNKKHHGTIITENLVPFLNLLDASRIRKVERFLTMSSACVYPKNSQIPLIEEEGLQREPEEAHKGYGWAKRMKEIASMHYQEESGIKIAIVRLSNVYGPRCNFDPESSNVIPGIIRRMHEGETPFTVWGGGQQTRSFMYVTDACKSLLELTAKKADANPINLGSNNEITIIDLIKTIAIILNKENLEYIVDESKPKGLLRSVADISRAKMIIDYSHMTPLEEGLKRTVDYYLSNIAKK